MLEEAKDDVDPPAYWMNRINTEIHWKTVFHRNIVTIKENKLKEFNFKILYNLLPVKRNLFLWKLRPNDLCEVCNCVEDLHHAFITCKLNQVFYQKLTWMIKKKFNIDIDKYRHVILLKLYDHSVLDEIITIALWAIYKLIVQRNLNGVDNRKHKLWYTFCNEISIRLELNQMCVKNGKKTLYNIPKDLNCFM